MSWMRKLRLREVKPLAQGHTAWIREVTQALDGSSPPLADSQGCCEDQMR